MCICVGHNLYLRLQVWDVETHACLPALGSCPGGVRSIAYSTDGKLLAAAFDPADQRKTTPASEKKAGRDFVIQLYQTGGTTAWQTLNRQKLPGHTDTVRSILFKPQVGVKWVCSVQCVETARPRSLIACCNIVFLDPNLNQTSNLM